MKIKALIPIVIIGFVLAFTYHFIAIAAIDAPHNESNNISCGKCHGQGLLQSPFWGGSMSYDQLCQYCHTESSCPGTEYPEITGPFAKTHVDSDENPLAECRTCHNPHYQNLKFYKNTDADELFLAWGKLECLEPEDTNCPYDSGNNTTTLKYTELNYKSESGWDATKLRGKTNPCRRTILFPDLKRVGFSYLVESIDEGLQTITVKGDARPVYGYFESWHIDSSSFAVIYGQFIREEINGSQVKFFDQTGQNSFADGVSAFNGACEICHTLTDHYRNDGSAPDQDHSNRGGKDGSNCVTCHSHVEGFFHCSNQSTGCHTDQSHTTHTKLNSKNPAAPLQCIDCHDIDNYPNFISGDDNNYDGKIDLSETDVCDICHSPYGAFNGVDTDIPTGSIGAKDNWADGVYQVDGALTIGKEKWCAGCHDNVSAVVNGNTAPDICGDNSTYGYYIGAHSNTGYGVNRNGVSYAQGECVHCHAANNISATSSHGGQLFADMNPTSQTDNFCFKCHTATGGDQSGSISINKSYSYNFAGNTSDDSYDNDIKEAFSHTTDSGSSHYLTDIADLFGQTLKDAAGNEWIIPVGTNPCQACHNPHLAQRNYPVSMEGEVLKTAILRPSQPNELWGDDSNERMSSVGDYYPPCWYYDSSRFEPDGTDTTLDGSNMPDYVRLCTDCHNTHNTILSTNPRIPRGQRNLTKFSWGVDDSYSIEGHGAGHDADNWHLRWPYRLIAQGINHQNVTLSCLDCHEPHGSHKHIYLMRTSIHATDLPEFDGEDDLSWGRLCNRCHVGYIGDGAKHSSAPSGCVNCHKHGYGKSF